MDNLAEAMYEIESQSPILNKHGLRTMRTIIAMAANVNIVQPTIAIGFPTPIILFNFVALPAFEKVCCYSKKTSVSASKSC